MFLVLVVCFVWVVRVLLWVWDLLLGLGDGGDLVWGVVFVWSGFVFVWVLGF